MKYPRYFVPTGRHKTDATYWRLDAAKYNNLYYFDKDGKPTLCGENINVAEDAIRNGYIREIALEELPFYL